MKVTSMPRSLLLTALLSPIMLFTAACWDAGTDGPQREIVTASPDENAADQDWAALTTSGELPNRLGNEGSLQYFMRQVELSDIRRRNLGLKFWQDHPDDPRRYKWLTLTVHMPPHYAQDIHEWTENETTIRPNIAVLDRDAEAAWETVYPALRKAFMDAPEVTDVERRFLWVGEIKHKVLRMIEADARDENIDGLPILDDIAVFAETYFEPYSENDKGYFSSGIQLLMDYVIGEHYALFGLNDRETVLAFVERLGETDNKIAVLYAKRMQSAIQKEGNIRSLIKSSSRQVPGTYHSLPRYPGNAAPTFEGRVAIQHDRFIMRRKFRDIGMVFWHEYFSHEEKVRWLAVTMSAFSVTYTSHFVDAIRAKAKAWEASVELDEDSNNEWERTYTALRSEIWNDPQTTNAQRGYIFHKEIERKLYDVKVGWHGNRDKSELQGLLDDIHKLYTEYGSGKDYSDPFTTAFGPWTLSTAIIREYKQLGMSDDDLLTFFEPMLSYEDEELQSLAKAAFNQVELRRTPFDFVAKTLHGEVFDMKDLRGQIVLVDHWSTGCASCIAAMPRLDNIYQEYKDEGFEVVSICYDATDEKKRVLRIEKELNLTWPTLDGQSQEAEIKRKYGYQGYPQYMLLNRDGTMYAGTGEVDMGRNLEALLDEILASENAQ